MAKGPTTGQVHIDIPLTNLSIAYRNDDYIGDQIFPAVPVQKISGKYFVYTKADWYRNEAGVRAPATVGPVSEYSLTAGTYACTEISHGKWVPDEVVENSDAPLQPRRDAAAFSTDKVLMYHEVAVAAEINGTGWASSATPSPTWDDDASNPIKDVEVARETIVGLIGREPNVLVVGRNVYADLLHHPDLLDRVKYSDTGMLNNQRLAQLLGVPKLLVGNAIYNSSDEGATASYSFIWGKHAWMGYVTPNPTLLSPSAGYTFTWHNRQTESIRQDIVKASLVRVTWYYDTKITATDAGYRFPSCVA